MPQRKKAPANVVPLLRREPGPAEITRAGQIRQFLNERLKVEDPVAAIVMMATADGRMATYKIGVEPTLMAVMRDEAHYISRRLHDDLVESQGATVHQFHARP